MARAAKQPGKTPPPEAPAPARTASARRPAAKGAAAVSIRMYRLGVGDCFLVTLPRKGGKPFRILIDCGIHMAETDGAGRIRAAVEDILKQSGKALDVVVGTHEHWDHLSGFHHGADLFGQARAEQIWCAWTENEDDPVARGLIKNRDEAVNALWDAVQRLRMAEPEGARPRDWETILGFFGDSPGSGPKAKQAAASLRKLVGDANDIVYRSPGEAPIDGISDDWRIFVLGPPRDVALLRRADPRPGSGEAYPLAAAELATGSLTAAVGEDDDPPFEARYQIPLEDSRAMAFFQKRYWADQAPDVTTPPPGSRAWHEEPMQDWRRVGTAWLDGAGALGLVLDKITNNTSLVLALELGPAAAKDNPVILFAADAQVGNWLSWKDVTWENYHGRTVSGPDLLSRTVVYKVGHHASHNATLMEGGLETMRRLRLAMVPTSEEMAGRVKWGTLPWPGLLDRLAVLTRGCVVRSDTGATPAALAMADITVVPAPDFAQAYDITIPLALRVRP